MPTTLARFYQHVRSGGRRPSCIPKLWRKWLWGTNCIELGTEACGDMNHMHVLGLLLCFMEEAYNVEDGAQCSTVQQLLPSAPLVHLYADKPIANYTLRELTTQLECLQLSWGEIMSNCDWGHVTTALKRLMARLGYLAHRAFPENDALDDPQYITQLPGAPLFIITRKCIRQLICIFFALFRCLYSYLRGGGFDQLMPLDTQGPSHQCPRARCQRITPRSSCSHCRNAQATPCRGLHGFLQCAAADG
jgi:hypothetical protein